MMKVLIIGGYGFFGRKLAKLLANHDDLSILLAGRTLDKAQAACDGLKGSASTFTALRLDRTQNIAPQIGAQSPDLIIDVSGPFQNYGERPYRVIEYALEAGCHYMDIADGADFVVGAAQFDAAAKAKGLIILSGVSTYPVLTSCVADRLGDDMDRITDIRAGIAPSPHNDMGRSVVEAIASYAGKPFPILKNGQITQAYGLTEGMSRTICVPGKLPLGPLLFSNVDVPDGRIFSSYYNGLQNIWSGAGPKPVFLHRVLMGLSHLVRWRVMPGLLWLSPVFHFCMKHIAGGAHRGGMFVEVDGIKNDRRVSRSWHLIGEGDDGPFIPILPLAIIVKNALTGVWPRPGARPALGDMTLADYEREFGTLDVVTGIFDDSQNRVQPLSLYEKALGSAYQDLAPAIQALHRIGERAEFKGRCRVTRGRHPLSGVIAFFFRFPKASPDIPVQVVMTVKDGIETWERCFDGRRMVSTQEAGTGRQARLITERFGPVAIHMAICILDKKLALETQGWSLFGLPLPRALLPSGEIFEREIDNRFNFHVDICVPLLGRLVKYEGWLVSQE